MSLPSPLAPETWPQSVRLIAWLALAGAAAVSIAAGAGVLAALLAAEGAIIGALIAGWLLSALATGPINALTRRGVSRTRAVALTWIAGAVPIIIVTLEIAFAFASSLGGVIAGPTPTPAQVAVLVARPTALLASLGLTINLVPAATSLIAALRDVGATVQGNLGALAAGAIGALGPTIFAIGTGIALSLRPSLFNFLDLSFSRSRARSVHRSRLILEEIIAKFIGRHLLLGAVFGVGMYFGATIAGADGLLAAVLGGAVMAVPSIGQGPAVLPPLVLALIAAGPYTPIGISIIVLSWLLCATQLAPRLTAGVLHLSGTVVFLAGSAGGLVAGPIGAVFALPITAAIEAIRRPKR